MSNIELLDIGDFYEKERNTVTEFGRQSFDLVSNSDVKQMLFERNLVSVISRYGKTLKHAEDSADTAGYLSSQSSKSGVSNFMIVDTKSNELLGQARIHDRLKLQIRPEAHRPNIRDRLVGKRIILSKLITEDWSNIDAWVKPSKNARNQLAQAYNILAGEVEHTWTTEPVDSVIGSQAIQQSGLTVVLPPKFYDCEVKNQDQVPLSSLFMSTDIELEIQSS